MGMLRGVRGGRRRHAGAPAEHRHGSSRRPAVHPTARASTTRCRVCACSTCTRPDGQMARLSRWSAGISRGTKTSGPSSFLGKEGNSESCRAQRAAHSLWSGPQGAPKAAVAAGTNTKVSTVAGKTVLTYPIPGVPGATATATLLAGTGDGPCARNCANASRSGQHVTEFVARMRGLQRAAQQDQSVLSRSHHRETGRRHDSRPSDRRDGDGNLYVIMPVPASVRPGATQ